MLDVLSMIPGVVWPAIPNARASQLLAVQFQLEQSQWLSAAELATNQARQVSVLYRHAYDRIPFYRQRFDEAGLSPERLRSIEQWSNVPLLSRRDIQMAGEQLRCATDLKAHGPITSTTTSGSSGQPVTTLGTTVTRLFASAYMLRQHIWHRRDFRLKLAAIRSLGTVAETSAKEQSADQWGIGTADILRTGPTVALDIHSSLEEQVDFLLRHDPDYINTYPSIVMELAEYFERSPKKLTRLREIRTFGEVLEPDVREACCRVWNVKVVDTYSSQEFGDIAMQCPDHEHYHVQSENLLVEVLDDEGRPCNEGQIGRLVITSMHNFAMPLIRYDIGDFAEVGPPCPCGRGLPVLKRIVGRQRNMFILPGGRRVWPSLELSEAEKAAGLPPIQQFQLVQRTVNSLELLVVSPRVFNEGELKTLRAWVDRSLGCALDLKITYVESIGRGVTGKYEDFRCEVDRAHP